MLASIWEGICQNSRKILQILSGDFERFASPLNGFRNFSRTTMFTHHYGRATLSRETSSLLLAGRAYGEADNFCVGLTSTARAMLMNQGRETLKYYHSWLAVVSIAAHCGI